MKKTIKIVIPLALALAVLTVIGLHPVFIPLKTKPVFLEVSPPLEVYHSEFLHHPEAWNEVFGNVSSIPRFWNSTVNSESAGRSVSEIAAMFEANVYVNDPEYAFCHISVPEESYQGLNRTLTELGFDVRNAVLMHLDCAHYFAFSR